MSQKRTKGVAIVEFSFVVLVLIPLLLGTVGFGIRLVQSIQTVQLARDVGHMYARGLDFSQPGNLVTLKRLGAEIGLNTDGTGNAVVVLSTLTYVDKGACQLAGKALDVNGNPINCPNYKQWVFAQRLVIGKTSIHTSNLGSPLLSGPGAVSTYNSTTGKIDSSDQINNTNDVATFASGTPFVSSPGSLTTLPTGHYLYITEVADQGFVMPVYDNTGLTYAFNIF
jgi:hypothetical protein